MGTYCGAILLEKRMVIYNKELKEENIDVIEYENYRTEKSCKISFIAALVAVILATTGVLIDTFISFLFGLAFGEFFLFLSISPFSIGIMTCISTNLRGQSNAVSLFVSFAIGGFSAPTAIGGIFELADHKVGIAVATGFLFFASLFWFLAWLVSRQCTGPLQYKWNCCRKRVDNHSWKIKLIKTDIEKDTEKVTIKIIQTDKDAYYDNEEEKQSIIGS